MDKIKFLLSLFTNVSKSLLIVLGTLPSPAVNWPWKVPPCRVNAPLQGLDNSKVRSYPHFPPPYYDDGGLACFIARSTPLFNTAGSAAYVLTSCLFSNQYFIFVHLRRAAPASRQRSWRVPPAAASVRLCYNARLNSGPERN